MIDRLKRALIESYVGAIALGYVFAQSIGHLAGIFATPIGGWISRTEYGGLAPHPSALPGFSLVEAVPELVRFLLLLLLGVVLLRWLYMEQPKS
jgi:hypothetical protein